MPSKKWIAVFAVLIAAAVFFSMRNDGQQEFADELAKREAKRQSAKEISVDTTLGFESEMFSLTDQVNAERADKTVWAIRSGTWAVIETPFRPSPNGQLASKPESTDSKTRVSQASEFLGAASCAECHQQKHSGFVTTAHHLTSAVVTESSARAPFNAPKNKMKVANSDCSFSMQREDDRFFQNVSLADWQLQIPLDIVTGSAKAGQTFLYWADDALFQAHASYVREVDQWIPSPGYDEAIVDFTRAIRSECLECHVTFIHETRGPNHYDRDSAVFGISCERCHGPGLNHVKFHKANPDVKEPKHITQPADLPRNRQLDICAQCHSGTFKLIGDPFSFRPGEKLDDYHKTLKRNLEVGGIHTSNQATRLKMSACFKESEMTCTTCHNPHQNQRGDTAVFTKSCMQCHEQQHCGMSEKLGPRIADNCIACHMPLSDNDEMQLNSSGGILTLKMIDHHIQIDPEATDEYLERESLK